jgi:hypothetical protein
MHPTLSPRVGTGDYALTDTKNGKGKFESLGKGKKPPKKDKDDKDIQIGDYLTIVSRRGVGGCVGMAQTGFIHGALGASTWLGQNSLPRPGQAGSQEVVCPCLLRLTYS